MESLSPSEGKIENKTSESSCIRPDSGNKISHTNSFHRLPALACELICGPHAYGSFCMKMIADSGALMRKVVHFLRYCAATVEQGSGSREQDKQLVGQLEFHCMLWSRLCISFLSEGSDSPCLVKFLEALHADTPSFISCAHKVQTLLLSLSLLLLLPDPRSCSGCPASPRCLSKQCRQTGGLMLVDEHKSLPLTLVRPGSASTCGSSLVS